MCHRTNLCAYVTTVVCAVRGLRPVAYYTLSCPLLLYSKSSILGQQSTLLRAVIYRRFGVPSMVL